MNDRIRKIDTLARSAMKIAREFGLIPAGVVDGATYHRHWNAFTEIVDQARAPLEDELTDLRSRLATSERECDEAYEGWALSRAAVGDAYTARLAMERKIGLLREWIREEGQRTNVCTFDILGGEVCGGCRCERGKI